MLKRIVFLLLLCVPAWCSNTATMTSTGSATSQISFVSSFADCVTSDCFHANLSVPGNAPKVFSGNGYTFAINPNGVYELTDYPNYAWVLHPEFGTVQGIQADSQGNIFSLGGAGCVGLGGYSVQEWNGSGWTRVSYCYLQFFLAPGSGDQILAIDLNGTLWTNVGGWQHASMPESKPAISATWVDPTSNAYMVVLNDNSIWQFNGTTWTQPTGGGCCALSIASDNQGQFYVVGTDDNIYHYNGSGYDKLVGPGAFSGTYGGLANGGSLNVWAVGPTISNNNIYRFSDTALQHTRTASGKITCTPIPPFNSSVCQGFTHTITWQAGFGTHYGKQFTYSFQGPNSWNAKASVNQDDIFAVMENPSDYPETVEGTVNCSGDGTLFNDVIGGEPLLRFTTTYWGPPVTEQGDNCYWGSLACSGGTKATCRGGSALAFVPHCPQYVKAIWAVFGGQCLVFEGAAATGPGPCD